VTIEVLIDINGDVESAAVISGHVLLRDAALAAVRQWKWRPTMLNGEPVKVMGKITFVFNLN
jgi:protein TonB